MVSRRGFLKILGGGALAVAAAPLMQQIAPAALVLPSSAPLFVPSTSLEMGVPRKILTATELPNPEVIWSALYPPAEIVRTIPMTLLYDEYLQEYGGRLEAGSTLLVDAVTAARWETNRVAVRPDGSSAERVLPGRGADRRLEAWQDWYATPQEWRRAVRLLRDEFGPPSRPPWVLRQDEQRVIPGRGMSRRLESGQDGGITRQQWEQYRRELRDAADQPPRRYASSAVLDEASSLTERGFERRA